MVDNMDNGFEACKKCRDSYKCLYRLFKYAWDNGSDVGIYCRRFGRISKDCRVFKHLMYESEKGISLADIAKLRAKLNTSLDVNDFLKEL